MFYLSNIIFADILAEYFSHYTAHKLYCENYIECILAKNESIVGIWTRWFDNKLCWKLATIVIINTPWLKSLAKFTSFKWSVLFVRFTLFTTFYFNILPYLAKKIQTANYISYSRLMWLTWIPCITNISLVKTKKKLDIRRDVYAMMIIMVTVWSRHSTQSDALRNNFWKM